MNVLLISLARFGVVFSRLRSSNRSCNIISAEFPVSGVAPVSVTEILLLMAEFCNTISLKIVLFTKTTLEKVKERTPVFRSKLKSLSTGIVSSIVKLDLIIPRASSLEIIIAMLSFVSLIVNSEILIYVVATLEPIVISSWRPRNSSGVRVIEIKVVDMAEADPPCSVNDLEPGVDPFFVSCNVIVPVKLTVLMSTVSEKLNCSTPLFISSEYSTRRGPVVSGIRFIVTNPLTTSSELLKKSSTPPR